MYTIIHYQHVLTISLPMPSLKVPHGIPDIP